LNWRAEPAVSSRHRTISRITSPTSEIFRSFVRQSDVPALCINLHTAFLKKKVQCVSAYTSGRSKLFFILKCY
jgi:hypothetical protein